MAKLHYIMFCTMLALILAGCGGTSTSGNNPFVGGDKAIEMSFVSGSPPTEILDNGQYGFDIGLEIKNVGEYDLQINDGYIEIEGISPDEYGVSSADLKQSFDSEILSRKKVGGLPEGGLYYLNFGGLEYQPDIAGDIDSTVIRAVACYDYVTKVTSNICVKRENLDYVTQNDVCQVSGDKFFANSGGPIQVTKVQTNPEGKNKIQVLFEISSKGQANDKFFKDGSDCDRRVNNPNRYLVKVNVKPLVNGQLNAQCTGLQSGSGSAGYVLLPEGQPRQVRCSFDTSSVNNDFETPLNIELEYRYMQFIETPIKIKDVATGNE